MAKESIILGIDPGTTVMGFGVIKIENSKLELLDIGAIKFANSNNHEQKLKLIYDEVIEIINKFHPDHLAIEAQFFGKNVQSMLKLGRAQGVAIAAALSREIPFTEYAPKKVKMSITGNGNASKEQVAKMLQSILKIKNLPEPLDATDALATAVCHHFQGGPQIAGKKYSGWDSFVKQNSGKVK